MRFGDQQLEILTGDVLGFVAEQPLRRGVEGLDPAVFVERDQTVNHMVEHRANPLAACPHGVLRPLPLNQAAEVARELVKSVQAKPIKANASARKEGKHADDPGLIADCECAPATQPGSGSDFVGTNPPVSGQIRTPVSVASFPNRADERFPARDLQIRSLRREPVELRGCLIPAVLQAKDVSFLIDSPELTNFPFELLTDSLQDSRSSF